MTEAQELLAIARFAGSSTHSSSGTREYRVTSGGDGLSVLQAPCEVWIHRPASDLKNLLAPSSVGIGKGDLFPARLNALRLMKGGGRVDISALDGGTFADSLEGCWLCVPRELLKNDQEIYRFELIGLEVREGEDAPAVGSVKDYFETGAHGILTVTLKETNQEILVPFIDEFTDLRFSEGYVLIPNLRDFMT